MNSPPESHVADRSENRRPAALPPAKARPEPARPQPLSRDAAQSEADPYWVPSGVELDDWSPALRADVASLINPNYRELVLLAKPGLAQSTGITIVHLLWLEILDQIELAQRKPAADLRVYPESV